MILHWPCQFKDGCSTKDNHSMPQPWSNITKTIQVNYSTFLPATHLGTWMRLKDLLELMPKSSPFSEILWKCLNLDMSTLDLKSS